EASRLAGMVRRYLPVVINIARRKAGVKCLKLQPRARGLTASAESFVSSMKYECLGTIIVLGERRLVRDSVEYVGYTYCEYDRHGLLNRFITDPPMPANSNAAVARRERLGGILTFSQCSAA